VLFGLLVVIAGQGAVAFGFVPLAGVAAAPLVAPVVPVVDVAPAGTFEFGLVVEVAEAGVEPVVVVAVPFCCVVEVAEAGGAVVVCGIVPLGWIPGLG